MREQGAKVQACLGLGDCRVIEYLCERMEENIMKVTVKAFEREDDSAVKAGVNRIFDNIFRL